MSLLIFHSLAKLPEPLFPDFRSFGSSSSGTCLYLSFVFLGHKYIPYSPFILQIYPSTFYPWGWFISSDEDVPYKIQIRIFPHNQFRLADFVLVNHTRNADYILGLQRQEYSGFHPDIWLNRISGWSIPLSGLSRPKAVRPLQKIRWRMSGSLPDLTKSSPRLSHLDVT